MNRRSASAFLLALAATICAPALRAQTPDALLSGFEPSGDWVLSVDGREVPAARLYFSKRAQAILIRTAEFPSPVLLDIAGRTAQTVDLMKVSERSDGVIDLLADAVLEPSGALAVTRTGATFSVGARKAEIASTPYLIGAKAGSDLLGHSAYYRYLAGKYTPDSGALGRLRGEKRDVRVLTFFGSWCPHCKEHVPLLLKVEQMLAGSKIDFDYRGMPGGRVSEQAEAKEWGVTGVPTTIVLVDGREVGRIPNGGWSQPEKALAEILAGGATPASR